MSKDPILIVLPSAFKLHSAFSKSGFQFSNSLLKMLSVGVVMVLPSSEIEYVLKQSSAFFVNHSAD